MVEKSLVYTIVRKVNISSVYIIFNKVDICLVYTIKKIDKGLVYTLV